MAASGRTWLFDLGNSRLKAAELGAGGRAAVQAFDLAEPDLWPRLGRWLAASGPPGPGQAWLSSVTDPVRRQALQRVLDEHGIAATTVGPARSDALLQLAYPEPDRFGVDRWLALRALRAELAGPFLLAGCGSALTVDAVDGAGVHLGGVIAPAPERAVEALRQRAPHLPSVPAQVRPFADNTEDAVWSGALLSAVGLIERLHAEAEHRLDRAVSLVLAGGGAAAVMPWLHGPVLLREHAVLDGLAGLAAAALPSPRHH